MDYNEEQILNGQKKTVNDKVKRQTEPVQQETDVLRQLMVDLEKRFPEREAGIPVPFRHF